MTQRLKLTVTALIVLIAIGLIICWTATGKQKVLVLKEGKEGPEHIVPIPDGTFTLSFIHSVHHTPVYEVFDVGSDNTISLREVRYSSLGVGMPYDYENGTLENTDGEFVLKFDREFDTISMKVSPIPEHKLTVGGITYPLLEFTKPEGFLEIKAVDKWLLKR